VPYHLIISQFNFLICDHPQSGKPSVAPKEDEEEKAAVVLQSHLKGMMVRKKMKEKKTVSR